MITDERGLALTTASEEAARAYDALVTRYVKYKADTASWVQKMLAADPDFAMGHCAKGYLMMTAFDARRLANAGQALAEARRHEAKLTPRERLHIAALDAWRRGALAEALEAWEAILETAPQDLFAARLAHLIYFWLGDRRNIREVAARPLARWSPELPGYGSMQAMLAFGHEECGDYARAEEAALLSLGQDRAELWATHARAHVMEMQGRAREGAAWLAEEERHWQGCNNMLHHVWWHRAMFHLELGEHDAVLELYDRKFRDLASPLVKALPDLYIDIQNAVSMLWRLEHLGVDAGGRWGELAEKAAARIGDVQNLFTVPHLVMALAAAGYEADARRYLAALHEAGRDDSLFLAATIRDVAAPVSAAVLAHRRGEHAKVVGLMEPVRGEIHRLGGSHAQRDLFTQLLLDSALASGRAALARAILAEETAARPAPLAGRRAYAAAAERLAS